MYAKKSDWLLLLLPYSFAFVTLITAWRYVKRRMYKRVARIILSHFAIALVFNVPRSVLPERIVSFLSQPIIWIFSLNYVAFNILTLPYAAFLIYEYHKTIKDEE